MIKFNFWKNKTTNNTKSITGNPFTSGSEGREEWNDRYFSMKNQISRWQIAFYILGIITAILSFTAYKSATQSHIQPVVVETCNGEPKAVLPVIGSLADEDRLVKYALGQFIINSRTIIADADAEKRILDQAYAYSAGNTLEFLDEYYKKNNPFTIANEMTAQIIIIDSMKISPHTWQITWDEIRNSTNGNSLLSKSRWVGTVTYQQGEVNPKFINQNPFGIYFQQITWSEIQVQKS